MQDNKKVILVVEDDGSLRRALQNALSKENYTVLEATNGQQGLEIALREHPDFILLDIMMPVMDGQTMLKKLRQDHWGATAKVAMLTNVTDNQSILEALKNQELAFYLKSDTPISTIVSDIKNRIM